MIAVRVAAAPVANDLEPAQHLANGKEANDFCDNNSCADHLLVVHVAHSGKDRARVQLAGVWGEFGCGSAGQPNGFEGGLEVRLEACDIAESVSQ